MKNYTTETYQTKRGILQFATKISKGLHKPIKNLCKDMVYGILTSKSSLLSNIARSLKEKTKLSYVIDRLSTNLMNLHKDDMDILKQNYLNEVNNYLPDDEVIVLNDDSDLNKEYSKKLEDLCVVRDASSQVERLVNGYKVCEYVALSKNKKTPISLYSKIYSTTSKDFKSENTETIKGEDFVIEFLKSKNKVPIFVRDRGYDANEFFKKDIKEGNLFVTRLKGNRKLLFKGKEKLVSEVVSKRKGKVLTTLMYKVENKSCYISYTRVELPCMKGHELTLVTIHGLCDEEGLPMMLLTNIKVTEKNSATRIVKLYFLRWRIEEYFKAKKEEFGWEDSLLRTMNAMNNYNLFLTFSMFYMTTIIEKLDTNYHANVIIERAEALRENLIILFGLVSKGIYNILKYAKTGIEEWKEHNEKRTGYKQLSLKI